MAENPEQADQGKQEPEKPKKKNTGMPMSRLLMIIGGILVVNAIAFIVIFRFFLAPADDPNAKDKDKAKKEKVKTDDEEFMDEDEAAEEDFFADESKRLYVETGRITTNPKMSTKFVIINVGMVFRPKEEVPPEQIKPDSDLMKKLQAKIKAVIIKEIGNLTVDELQAKRGELDIMLRDKLRPVYKESKIFLREVNLTEFIMQ